MHSYPLHFNWLSERRHRFIVPSASSATVKTPTRVSIGLLIKLQKPGVVRTTARQSSEAVTWLRLGYQESAFILVKANAKSAWLHNLTIGNAPPNACSGNEVSRAQGWRSSHPVRAHYPWMLRHRGFIFIWKKWYCSYNTLSKANTSIPVLAILI